MNFELGFNIAKITSRKKERGSRRNDIRIYVAGRDDRDAVRYTHTEIAIPTETDDIIQQVPFQNLNRGVTRQVLYVSGASGSGKSYYVAQFLKEYTKMFPKNPIFLFSSLTEDKTLDECKNVVRINFKDESFYNADYSDIKKFQDTLVLYDDTEMISDRFISTKLKNLQDLILTTGRHNGVFCIVTSHICNQRERTKLILAEAFSLTLFLDNMGYATLEYTLQAGFGFKRQQIDMIYKLDSRCITIFKTAPITIMHDKGILVMPK